MNSLLHSKAPLAWLISVLLVSTALGNSKNYLANTVEPMPPHPAGMMASDIPIRGLKPRERSIKEPNDTLEAINTFYATRLEWIYEITPDFAKKVIANGTKLSAAVNTATQRGLEQLRPDWKTSFQIRTLDGQSTTAPWMRPWKGGWYCVNQPEVRQAYLRETQRLLDLGAIDLQRDDPAGNSAAGDWGACFCPYCIEGFRKYLCDHFTNEQLLPLGITNPRTFDYAAYLRDKQAPVGDAFRLYKGGRLKELYRAFQEDSMIVFYHWWRTAIDNYAKRHIAVSFNGMRLASEYPSLAAVSDWGISELTEFDATPDFLVSYAKKLIAAGRYQTLTMPLANKLNDREAWLDHCRSTLASIYALGMHMEVPWDTYLPPPATERYFGKPIDFSDLYGFIRANSMIFDNYELAYTLGAGSHERKKLSRPITLEAPASNQILVAVRVKPKDTEAPVVIQLVNWSNTPTPLKLKLVPSKIFNRKSLKATMFEPVVYNKKIQQEAIDERNYTGLRKTTTLDIDSKGCITIPQFSKWAIIALEPVP